ncbi:MAG: sigma 54-interacting transcriptional regulator [Syntrophomonadaceae bacterium]
MENYQYATIDNLIFEKVFHKLPPVILVNAQGIIAWSNRDRKDLVPHLPIGVCVNDCLPDLRFDKMDKLARQELMMTIQKVEYRITVFSLIKDQYFPGYILLFDDSNYILTLKKQLAAYASKYDLLYQVFNMPYSGTIYVNEEGVIQWVNDMFSNYVRIKKDHLIGHKLEEYKIDPGLLEVMKKGKPDLLNFYPHPKLIAQRHPVYKEGKLVGAFGQYISLDMNCIRRNIFEAEEYINIISRLEARDIMLNVNQFVIELNSYKDEFQKTHSTSIGMDSIRGNCPKILTLKNKVLTVALSPSSVLITGESGTGKELFAQAIHSHSERASFPFVKVNCAAIPDNLMESELFGYVDGAFTGARKGGKMGKFELANKGTIFLDEIGDMPLSMQAKLLRVLQEREIERVGDNKTIPINVRIISATNKNLKSLVESGTFRLDLYYRLNVVNLDIPPLRERVEDIPLIARQIIQDLNRKLTQNVTGISPEAVRLLMQYHWPGNVRELVNILETAMNFCRTSELGPENLIFFDNLGETPFSDKSQKLKSSVSNTEKAQIVSVLKAHNGDRKSTAASLGVSRTTLYRLMKKHDLL